MTRIAIGFVTGVLFAVGLVVAAMTDPAKVLAFLDVGGAWDPSLALVMGGAIGVFLPLYRWSLGRTRPLFSDAFRPPGSKPIDARLIVGAAIFGVGWGAAGYCPGPAVVSLPSGAVSAIVCVAGIVAGMGFVARLKSI